MRNLHIIKGFLPPIDSSFYPSGNSHNKILLIYVFKTSLLQNATIISTNPAITFFLQIPAKAVNQIEGQTIFTVMVLLWRDHIPKF